jgi:hypothetical protein
LVIVSSIVCSLSKVRSPEVLGPVEGIQGRQIAWLIRILHKKEWQMGGRHLGESLGF